MPPNAYIKISILSLVYLGEIKGKYISNTRLNAKKANKIIPKSNLKNGFCCIFLIINVIKNNNKGKQSISAK
jgi:hypothetical protein